MILDVVKVFIPTAVSFLLGIALSPLLTHYLYRYRMWKKSGGKIDYAGKEAVIFNSLHKETESGTPRLGGIIVWGSAALTVILFWLLARILPTDSFLKLDFLSRSQTWLPLFTLCLGAVIGLVIVFLAYFVLNILLTFFTGENITTLTLPQLETGTGGGD